MILKKNVLQVHMRKKKIPAQEYCPNKKIMHRIVGWKKNSGKMFWVDTLNFISSLLKDFSIWTWVKGDSLHNDVSPSDGFFFTFVAPVVTNLDTCFLNFKIMLVL